jgi:hypothetical protein
MASTCELLINVVKNNKPNLLRGLNQKVRGEVILVQIQETLTPMPPAKRQRLTRSCRLSGTR